MSSTVALSLTGGDYSPDGDPNLCVLTRLHVLFSTQRLLFDRFGNFLRASLQQGKRRLSLNSYQLDGEYAYFQCQY